MNKMLYNLTKAEIDAIRHEVQFGGMTQIKKERQRQKYQEGYDFTHDDEHVDGSLAAAAATYVLRVPDRWPWSDDKPQFGPNRQRELVKAGALYLAEIDRLQRVSDAYHNIVIDIAREIDALDAIDSKEKKKDV